MYYANGTETIGAPNKVCANCGLSDYETLVIDPATGQRFALRPLPNSIEPIDEFDDDFVLFTVRELAAGSSPSGGCSGTSSGM